MSLKPNIGLQTGVDYMVVARPGGVVTSKPESIDTFEYGTTLTTSNVLGFGRAVVLDTDGGVTLPTVATTKILGFVTFQNNGIIDYAGYVKGGIMPNVPVLTLGRIYVPVKTGETLVVGDAVSLYVAAGADFNTVEKTPLAPGADDIDISAQVKVSKPSANGLVELTVVTYTK
jgi:hypothetical protein